MAESCCRLGKQTAGAMSDHHGWKSERTSATWNRSKRASHTPQRCRKREPGEWHESAQHAGGILQKAPVAAAVAPSRTGRKLVAGGQLLQKAWATGSREGSALPRRVDKPGSVPFLCHQLRGRSVRRRMVARVYRSYGKKTQDLPNVAWFL